MKLDAWMVQDHSLDENLRLIEGLSQAVNEVHDRGESLGGLQPDRIEVDADGGCDLSETRGASPSSDYAPPDGEGDSAADVYAVGRIAWEILAGRSAGEAPRHLSEVRPDISKELADAIMACLEESADWRPKDLTFLAQMAAARQKGAARAPRRSRGTSGTSRRTPARTRRTRQGQRTWPLLAALVVVLALAAFAWRQFAPAGFPGSGASPASPTPPAPATAPPAAEPAPPTDAPATAPTPEGALPAADTPAPLAQNPPPPAQESAPQTQPVPPAPPPPAPEPAAPPRTEPQAPPTAESAPVAPRRTTAPARPAPAPPAPVTDSPPASASPSSAAPTPSRPAPPPAPAPAPEDAPAESAAAPAAPPAPPAVLTTVSPLQVKRPGKVLLDLRGQGFRDEHRVRVLPVKKAPRGISVVRLKRASDTLITVLIDLTDEVEPGEYAIALEDGLGTRTDPLIFTVTK